MTDVFSTPTEYANDLQSSDLHSSLAERLAAQGADALDPQNSLSGAWLFRRARELSAGGADLNPGAGGEAELFMHPAALQQRQADMDARRATIPDVSMADAKARVKQEGLEGHLTLPSQDSMKAPVLDLMVSEAHERRDREAAIARGPQGFIPGALGLVTSLGVGMIDPVNAAAFSIPVLGEARWGKLLYSAGDSMLARGGVRALQGAAQGAVGTAVLQPADWWLHTRDGQDYTMADALKNVAMGAGMGAVAHAGFGAFGDFRAKARGEALPGSPEAQLADALSGGPEPATGEIHPSAVIADLPAAAREDAMHAAAADVIADRPVRSADMLQIAADHDPRIAESLDRKPTSVAGLAGAEPHVNEFGDVSKDTFDYPIKDTVGNKVGEIQYITGTRHDSEANAITIRSAGIEDAAARGKGLGTKAYQEIIDWALANGKTVYSSGSTNDLSDAVYERLRKQGYNVTKVKDGAGHTFEIKPKAKYTQGDLLEAQQVYREALWRTQQVENNPSHERFAAEAKARLDEIERSLPASQRAASHGERAAQAAEDPRWRALSDAPPAHSDAQAIAESKAADAEPEPASVQPEKSQSAIEKAAADVEEAWRKSELAFTEEERQSVNDALDQLETDRKAREQIITEGAMCLAGRTLEEVA